MDSILEFATFPMTREDIENFPKTLLEKLRVACIDDSVDYVSTVILDKMARRKTPETWGNNDVKNLQLDTNQIFHRGKYGRMTQHYLSIRNSAKSDRDGMIDAVVAKLQERFPHSAVMTDPLKSYIYINWSGL